MNVIFGSGVVGLLAKIILGPDWKVIPFAKSRFFSWNPALDDNFIITDPELDPLIKDMTRQIGPPTTFPYKRSWSIGGELINTFQKDLCDDWLYKIFGADLGSQVPVYMQDRLNLQIYDVRVNQLYYQLVNTFHDELTAESSKGPVTEIGSGYYVQGGQRHEFQQAVSTIPLDALYKLMGYSHNLQYRAIHYCHVETENLDFEGNNQVLVVDGSFDFFKVTNIAKNRYLFYFHNNVENFGIYLMNFISGFDIIDGTMIENAIPLGSMPNLSHLEQSGIYCVGSYAQHDWCADVGSNILRLLRYSHRDNKPATMKPI